MVRKRVAMVCLGFIAVVYLSGIFAPWVAPFGYNEQDLDRALEAPSIAHPLGTDRVGRDQLSRIIWGARTAVIVSVLAVTFGAAIGIPVGLAAGYYGRRVDTVISRVADIFFAFPGLLLVIVLAGTIRPPLVELARSIEDDTGFKGLVASGAIDYVIIFGALALVGWPGMMRLVRGQILVLRQADFVEAALAIGATGRRIMFRHLLPNAGPILIVSLTAAFGAAVTSEVVLSFLGLGIQPPNPSWGRMIFENLGLIRTPQWYLLMGPALVVTLIFIAFSLFGDALNDVLNPRSR